MTFSSKAACLAVVAFTATLSGCSHDADHVGAREQLSVLTDQYVAAQVDQDLDHYVLKVVEAAEQVRQVQGRYPDKALVFGAQRYGDIPASVYRSTGDRFCVAAWDRKSAHDTSRSSALVFDSQSPGVRHHMDAHTLCS